MSSMLVIADVKQSSHERSAYETRSTRNQYAFSFHVAPDIP